MASLMALGGNHEKLSRHQMKKQMLYVAKGSLQHNAWADKTCVCVLILGFRLVNQCCENRIIAMVCVCVRFRDFVIMTPRCGNWGWELALLQQLCPANNKLRVMGTEGQKV